jgi:hypothetical protein
MIKVPKVQPNNRLVNSSAYPIILSQYNELLARDGKVNNKKFYEDVVREKIPSYSMQAWYDFVKRFKSSSGLVATTVSNLPLNAKEDSEIEVKTTMLTNQEATAKLIAGILNISATAAQNIIDNPELLSTKDRIELGLKGMKAQDSRIHAVGKLREDNREQERFDRAFDSASFGGEE